MEVHTREIKSAYMVQIPDIPNMEECSSKIKKDISVITTDKPFEVGMVASYEAAEVMKGFYNQRFPDCLFEIKRVRVTEVLEFLDCP